MNPVNTNSWYTELDASTKKLTLVLISYNLTLALRGIAAAMSKDETLAAALLISELNHRLMGCVTADVTNRPGYPDDVIISMVDGTLSDRRLGGHADFIWGSVKSTIGKVKSK